MTAIHPAIVLATTVLLACLLVAFFEARRFRQAKEAVGEPRPRKKVKRAGAPLEVVPFSARRRVLKVCPDCGELVLLETTECKHCGCAFAMDAAAGKSRPE